MSILDNFKKILEKPKFESIPVCKALSIYTDSQVDTQEKLDCFSRGCFALTGVSSFTKTGAINKAYEALEKDYLANFYFYNDGLNVSIENFVKNGLGQRMSKQEDKNDPLQVHVLNDGNTLILKQSGWYIQLERDDEVVRGIQGPESIINDFIDTIVPISDKAGDNKFVPLMESFVATTNKDRSGVIFRDSVSGANNIVNGAKTLELSSVLTLEKYGANDYEVTEDVVGEESVVITTSAPSQLIPSPISKLEDVVAGLKETYNSEASDIILPYNQVSDDIQFNM